MLGTGAFDQASHNRVSTFASNESYLYLLSHLTTADGLNKVSNVVYLFVLEPDDNVANL
jgi:hypothetical protein